MKKYLKEIIVLIIQILFFYIMPLTAGPTDMMGLVVLLILVTFILSIIIGSISNNKIKFLYPLVISIAFIPSIFIYYNESALIHSSWYLIVSIFGMLIGVIINLIIKKKELINMKKVEKKYDIKFITFALSVLVALVFFLMILLVGTDYYHNRVCYNDSCTCEDNKDLNTEEIIEEDHTCTCVTKENDSVSFPYYNPMYGKKLFDIYSINSLEGSYMTFKYNNKLYFIDSIDMNDLFDCATDFTTDKEDGKLITQGGVYECYTNDSDDEDDNSGPSQVTIKEFDVDVNNIYNVVVESYPHSTGEDLSIFFIYKNGKVDYYHYDGMSTKIYKNVLKSYKVKGIKVNCKKWDDVSCKKTELELTLQNGKTAKVNNFNFR